MGSGRLVFSGSQVGVDELAGGTSPRVNVLTDHGGALRQRPGLAVWEDFPAGVVPELPIIGIGSWHGKIIFVTSDRSLWAWLGPGVVIPLSVRQITDPLYPAPASFLDGALRPVIVPGRDRVIISGGGIPQKWDGLGYSSRLANAPAMSHIVDITRRLVGNAPDDSGLIYWSDIDADETWNIGLNFMEAETKRDPVTGLYTCSNELIALGTRTIQMLAPDATNVFTPSRTIEIGWSASPHSFIGFDEQWFGVDAKARIIQSNGRSYSFPSLPSVGDEIPVPTDAVDCWGGRLKMGNKDIALFKFSTDGRSFAYDVPTKTWSQWHGFDSAVGGISALAMSSLFYWEEAGLQLAGLDNGTIAILSPEALDDLGDPIVTQSATTFVDHGTQAPKKNNALFLRMRRGAGQDGDSAELLLDWRDDLGAFCDPIRIEIASPDSKTPVVELRSLGNYQQRQWRITYDVQSPFVLASAMEDFTILR